MNNRVIILTDNFKADIYIYPFIKGKTNENFVLYFKSQVFFHIANNSIKDFNILSVDITQIILGKIIFEDISAVKPGDSLVVTIKLVNKIPLNLGLKFLMKVGKSNDDNIIGEGTIVKLGEGKIL